MPYVTTQDGTNIFYKDWGSGQPIVFHHGWPLSADDWDNQMLFFLGEGYRVIAHDRRGHGRSAQVSEGRAQLGNQRQVSRSQRRRANHVHVGVDGQLRGHRGGQAA